MQIEINLHCFSSCQITQLWIDYRDSRTSKCICRLSYRWRQVTMSLPCRCTYYTLISIYGRPPHSFIPSFIMIIYGICLTSVQLEPTINHGDVVLSLIQCWEAIWDCSVMRLVRLTCMGSTVLEHHVGQRAHNQPW